MSSSDSSDNEEFKKRLTAALDPNFTLQSTTQRLFPLSIIENPIIEIDKSKRKNINLEWDPGHFQTFKLGTEAKSFIYKRLNEYLNKEIKYVNIHNINYKEIEKEDDDDDMDTSGIYLFNTSLNPISKKDLQDNNTKVFNSQIKKQKKIKKRKLKDESESEDENTKLKSVAVNFDWVKNGKY